MQFFKDEFNVTKGKRAIYNHMPETTSEEVFIDKDEVLSLHSKYGNELKAIKEGDKFRVYTMKIRGIYECIDCKHQDERPVPQPLLFEKRGRYKLNKGVHHSICFLWTKMSHKKRMRRDNSWLFKWLEALGKQEKNTNFFNKLRRNAASAMRWTMKVDLQSFYIILVPIHLPGHWALSIMDMRKKGMYFFDSMLGDGRDCLRELREFLVLESVAKRGKAFNTMD
uniref:Ubiquitin-like protease family profile domain-containing protein n=1 Tax=Ditylenchus dipsaci TaxID=166011 RepID=A0A915DR50_9BILA